MSDLSTGIRVTTSPNVLGGEVEAADNGPSPFYGWATTRGKSWDGCNEWFSTTPGSLFQLTCLLFFLAFMGGGQHVVAAMYTHVLCTFAFLVFSIFGGIDACSPDMVVWGVILMVINIVQIVNITFKMRSIDEVFDSDMQTIYHKRFAPFNVSPALFAELVTCKGCQVTKLEKGQKYCAEGKTPVEKVSMLISGKLNVIANAIFLHSVTGNDFIDSPEWESLKSAYARTTYNVTITADTETRYITWRRKPLLTLLGKRKRLSKLFNSMIGRDVLKKLYSLNSRQFNARGFHYDIRLPCIMSLRDDVMEREKKRQEVASQPGTPAGRRHKKLGKKANEHYARLFARRMSEKITMLKERKNSLQPGKN